MIIEYVRLSPLFVFAQQIFVYFPLQKKAEDSQKLFQHLNNNIDLTIPLYEEANDLESIRRIRIQYVSK